MKDKLIHIVLTSAFSVHRVCNYITDLVVIIVVIVVSSDLTLHLLICRVSTTLSVGWYCSPVAPAPCCSTSVLQMKISECQVMLGAAYFFLNALGRLHVCDIYSILLPMKFIACTSIAIALATQTLMEVHSQAAT